MRFFAGLTSYQVQSLLFANRVRQYLGLPVVTDKNDLGVT